MEKPLRYIPDARLAMVAALVAVLGGMPEARAEGMTIGEANRAWCKEDPVCYAGRGDSIGFNKFIGNLQKKEQKNMALHYGMMDCDRNIILGALEAGGDPDWIKKNPFTKRTIREKAVDRCAADIAELFN